MMNYTYKWQAQPYMSWKTATDTGNSAVPSFSRPQINGVDTNFAAANSGNNFLARPIKHWRKQLNPVNGSGRGRAGIGMPGDVPGGSVYLGSATPDCLVCSDSSFNSTNGNKTYIFPDNTSTLDGTAYYDISLNKMVCSACNPETHIIKSAVTLLNKKYYSDRQAYLHSRGQTYDQNISTTKVAGIVYVDSNGNPIWPSNNNTTGTQIWNTPTCCPATNTTAAIKTIYKPNNNKFATQCAVSSSTRLLRLQNDTITKNGNSFRSAFGASGANAGKYQGTSTAPYFLKSKYAPCVNHHKNGDHTVCFNTATGSV